MIFNNVKGITFSIGITENYTATSSKVTVEKENLKNGTVSCYVEDFTGTYYTNIQLIQR